MALQILTSGARAFSAQRRGQNVAFTWLMPLYGRHHECHQVHRSVAGSDQNVQLWPLAVSYSSSLIICGGLP